jgi:glyoxylase-like metal-dependent hydrolase (beta-lactamase superfamily II)
MKIIPIDCNYVTKEFATSYLLVENGRALFVESNTNYAIPYLLAALKAEGLSPTDVDGLIITHVHLDHAGGAGLFLQECPQAKLYAHPRAARHAIDPSKLVASATQVYGEAFMQKLYGTILPCAAERVVVLEDGDAIDWQGVKLKTKHTRGHANHHLCILEPTTNTLFSGDAFGVSYSSINLKKGLVVLASTSPTDFDGEAAIATVKWIRDLGVARVALTHFGFLTGAEIQQGAQQLLDEIHYSMQLMQKIKTEKLDEKTATAELTSWVVNYFSQQNVQLDQKDIEWLSLDLQVNAQGLVFAAQRDQK